jgi:predicted GNAT superfamily acetyltransferase
MGAGEAWDLAHGAAGRSGVELAALENFGDVLDACRVIGAVWGDDAAEAHYIRAIQHAGNVFIGARAGEDLVGFVLGLLGSSEGLHVHSHMLAVVPGWRSKGVGYALKLAQRAATLDLGLEEVRWTFDPLVARNAAFNLGRLGAVGTRWLPNFYGEMADEINRGERSDRFEVRWPLRDERTERVLTGAPAAVGIGAAVLDVAEADGVARPRRTGADPHTRCTVAVPQDHVALRRTDPGLAREWRDACAGAFDACFARGLVATWFTRDLRYVFTEPDA